MYNAKTNNVLFKWQICFEKVHLKCFFYRLTYVWVYVCVCVMCKYRLRCTVITHSSFDDERWRRSWTPRFDNYYFTQFVRFVLKIIACFEFRRGEGGKRRFVRVQYDWERSIFFSVRLRTLEMNNEITTDPKKQYYWERNYVKRCRTIFKSK